MWVGLLVIGVIVFLIAVARLRGAILSVALILFLLTMGILSRFHFRGMILVIGSLLITMTVVIVVSEILKLRRK
jgi:uncharacterized membrane protein